MGFDKLPPEILWLVLERLSIQQLVRLRRVSKLFDNMMATFLKNQDVETAKAELACQQGKNFQLSAIEDMIDLHISYHNRNFAWWKYPFDPKRISLIDLNAHQANIVDISWPVFLLHDESLYDVVMSSELLVGIGLLKICVWDISKPGIPCIGIFDNDLENWSRSYLGGRTLIAESGGSPASKTCIEIRDYRSELPQPVRIELNFELIRFVGHEDDGAIGFSMLDQGGLKLFTFCCDPRQKSFSFAEYDLQGNSTRSSILWCPESQFLPSWMSARAHEEITYLSYPVFTFFARYVDPALGYPDIVEVIFHKSQAQLEVKRYVIQGYRDKERHSFEQPIRSRNTIIFPCSEMADLMIINLEKSTYVDVGREGMYMQPYCNPRGSEWFTCFGDVSYQFYVSDRAKVLCCSKSSVDSRENLRKVYDHMVNLISGSNLAA